MKSEVKRDLLAYLPGKRKARGLLRNKAGGKCIGGHLCELYRLRTGCGYWQRGWWPLPNGWAFYCESNPGGVISTVPEEVLQWAGLHKSMMESLVAESDTQPGFPIKFIEKWL